MGNFAHLTSITSTPSCLGIEFRLDTFVLFDRVIIVTLCPDNAIWPARWNTTDPIPPHRGGYSPDNIAMCTSINVADGASLFNRWLLR